MVFKPRYSISRRSKCPSKYPCNTWYGRVLEVCSTAGECTSILLLDHDFANLLVPKTVHVNCLYNIHKRTPPSLDDEPRYTDVRGLTDFKIEALYARVSILTFLGILQKGSSSFADPGQENTDLGIQQSAGGSDNPTSAPVGGELDGKISSQPEETWKLIIIGAIEDFQHRTLPTDPARSTIRRNGLPDLMQSQQWNLLPPSESSIDNFSPSLALNSLGNLTGCGATNVIQSDFDLGLLDIDGWDYGSMNLYP